MLKADILGEGKMKYYDNLFPGYHALVERNSLGSISGISGSTAWGMVYLVLPEDRLQALDHNEAELLADALAAMLKAAAHMARLMNATEDTADGS